MAVSSAYRWLSFFASRASACVSGWDSCRSSSACSSTRVLTASNMAVSWLAVVLAIGPKRSDIRAGLAFVTNRRVARQMNDAGPAERRPASWRSYLESASALSWAVFLA